MAYALQPPEAIARDLYDRLVPFAGLFNWSGISLTDPNDLSLAMTAAALGEHDAADRHFADGIARLRAGRRRARTLLVDTHVLGGDPRRPRRHGARTREQAKIAVELGTELGLDGPHGVVPRAQAILDAR